MLIFRMQLRVKKKMDVKCRKRSQLPTDMQIFLTRKEIIRQTRECEYNKSHKVNYFALPARGYVNIHQYSMQLD